MLLKIIPLSQIKPVLSFKTISISIIIITFWTINALSYILLWPLFTSFIFIVLGLCFKKIYTYEAVSVNQLTVWVESEWVVATIHPLKWFLYLQNLQDQTFDK